MNAQHEYYYHKLNCISALAEIFHLTESYCEAVANGLGCYLICFCEIFMSFHYITAMNRAIGPQIISLNKKGAISFYLDEMNGYITACIHSSTRRKSIRHKSYMRE